MQVLPIPRYRVGEVVTFLPRVPNQKVRSIAYSLIAHSAFIVEVLLANFDLVYLSLTLILKPFAPLVENFGSTRFHQLLLN